MIVHLLSLQNLSVLIPVSYTSLNSLKITKFSKDNASISLCD